MASEERHTLVFHIIRLAKKMQEALGFKPFPYGLNSSQASTILFISVNKEVNQVKLAHHLHLKPASIVTLVDELERLALVTRKAANATRREYQITLTRKGTQTVDQIEKITYQLDDFLRDKLAGPAAQNLQLTLEKLATYLDDWQKSPSLKVSGQRR